MTIHASPAGWLRLEVERGLPVDAFAQELAARIPLHAREGLWVWYVPLSALSVLVQIIDRRFPGHSFAFGGEEEGVRGAWVEEGAEEGRGSTSSGAPEAPPDGGAEWDWARVGGFDSTAWWEQFFATADAAPPRRAWAREERGSREGSYGEPRGCEAPPPPPPREARDPYEVLGVSRNASKDEVREAYRRCVFATHPDRRGGEGAGTAEAFLRVQGAYEQICLERGFG